MPLLQVASVVSFLAGVCFGIPIGVSLIPHLPPVLMQGVTAMRQSARDFISRHTALLVVILLFSTCLTIGGFVSYYRCVGSYVAASGRAQAPRAVASVATQESLHHLLSDTKRFGGNSPRANTDLDLYLNAYHRYARAVDNHPLPGLPWCLRA